MNYLLIAQTDIDIATLKEGLRFRLMHTPLEKDQSCGVSIEEILISEYATDTRHWFQALSTTFEKLVDKGRLTVLVSGLRPHYLNPMVDYGLESVFAMLILAFPDARWMFGTIRGYADASQELHKQLDQFRLAHGIGNLFHPNQNPLLDGTGLRDWVRYTAAAEADGGAGYLPRRKETQVAFALDDESRYSYLNAYTAYRFGFRATAINNVLLANHLLGKADSIPSRQSLPIPYLIFEDIYVNFAGGTPGLSWLGVNPKDGRGRSKEWPRLEQAEYRIFVTSGQRLSGDKDRWDSNQKYFADQRAEGKYIETLDKPYAGIFRLWGRTYLGVAKGFIWPPPKESFSVNEHGHSSPGVLLIIAEKLIERAENLLPDVRSVQRAVQGAVWATDALEILGGRTPTIAIEALKLKHHFEVVAECQFAGVDDHIEIEERFREIKRDVMMVSDWFRSDQQDVASINAEMKILTDLVRVFREFAQFDEEQLCLQKVRTLQNRLWLQKQKPRNWLLKALIYPIYGIRWYVAYLLGSIRRFVLMIGAWIVSLTGLYVLAGNVSLSCAFKSGFISFIAIQPNTPDPNFGVTLLAMLSGVTHLGILISHLYSLVSRK
jgi:hypothetical protein